MRVTFLNDNSSNDLEKTGRKYLASRASDFNFFEIFRWCESERDFIKALKEQDYSNLDELETYILQFKDLGDFNNYGLAFEYMEIDERDPVVNGDYFRYQLSWGGPSDEVRFYADGRIEYVYLDWFCGVGFDVSNEDWAAWLAEHFEECMMLDFDAKREETYYYEILYSEEDSD